MPATRATGDPDQRGDGRLLLQRGVDEGRGGQDQAGHEVPAAGGRDIPDRPEEGEGQINEDEKEDEDPDQAQDGIADILEAEHQKHVRPRKQLAYRLKRDC